MPLCNEMHPTDSTRRCVKTSANHADHDDGLGAWPNEEVQQQLELRRSQRPSKARSRATVRTIAKKAREGVREFNGVPVEARVKWSEHPWTKQARQAYLEFLATREEPFTQAEDVWPLLDAPPVDLDMRAMTQITQGLLREGLIEKVGTRFLGGTYTTRDHVLFSQNKEVPVYVSRVAR